MGNCKSVDKEERILKGEITVYCECGDPHIINFSNVKINRIVDTYDKSSTMICMTENGKSTDLFIPISEGNKFRTQYKKLQDESNKN